MRFPAAAATKEGMRRRKRAHLRPKKRVKALKANRTRTYRPYATGPNSTTRPVTPTPLRLARDTSVAEEDMTGTVREYLYAGGEAPTAMRARQGDGSYKNFFFQTNTHGDVVAVTDRDGVIVNRYAYGPWGEATRVSEQVHQPFRYAGYRYEDGFDLYYLRARWMDPNTGRFLSRDSERGEPERLLSLNRYLYAAANPGTNDDPFGLDPARPRNLDLTTNQVDPNDVYCDIPTVLWLFDPTEPPGGFFMYPWCTRPVGDIWHLELFVYKSTNICYALQCAAYLVSRENLELDLSNHFAASRSFRSGTYQLKLKAWKKLDGGYRAYALAPAVMTCDRSSCSYPQ